MGMIKYNVKLRLTQPVLGATPQDPQLYQKFLIERHQDLIEELSRKFKDNNRYLGEEKLTDEQKELELSSVFNRIEMILKRSLEESEKKKLLGTDTDIKNAIAEILGDSSVAVGQVFLRDSEHLPFLAPHVIKGFLKSAAEAICRTKKRVNGKFLGSNAASITYISQYVKSSPVYFLDKEGERVDVDKDEKGNPKFFERPLRIKEAKERTCLASSEIIHAVYLSFELSVWDGAPISKPELLECFDYGQMVGISQWRTSGEFGCFEVEEFELVKS